jgi:hypothetical protein
MLLPINAGGSLVRLEGWIVDSRCGVKNANEAGAADTIKCYESGAKLIFIAKDGLAYDIEDQERALKHVGHQVGVFGTVDGARMLTVGRYIGEEKEEKEATTGLAPTGVKPN